MKVNQTMKNTVIAVLLSFIFVGNVDAKNPEIFTHVSKVYSQVVSSQLPSYFEGAYRNQADPYFIVELVPKGETVEQWSEMVTFTGLEGAIKQRKMGAGNIIDNMTEGFSNACPNTFAAQTLLENPEMLAVVLSCGNAGGRSEETLVVAMNGVNDLYTVQWAERGKATSAPKKIDKKKWSSRLQLLNPKLSPLN